MSTSTGTTTAMTTSNSEMEVTTTLSSEIPAKYKAAVYDKPGEISTKVVELDTPEPGPGQVLIRLTHSGVCHSDLAIMTKAWHVLRPYPTPEGQVGGHEGVGQVVKMGPGTENTSVKVGDRVGIKWVNAKCDTCPACLAGYDALCFKVKISGFYTPGTFQQYVLGPANYVTPIPDGLDSAMAAPMLCAGVTGYSALKKSGAAAGDFVAVFGAGGGLGHITCQLGARGMGFRVIGIDHGSKERVARDSGVEVFVDYTTQDITKTVKDATDQLGVQAVIVCTAANAAYGAAIDLLSFGGRLVCVGIPEGEPLPISGAAAQQMVGRAQSIVGVSVGDRKEVIETLNFAKRGIVKSHVRLEKMSNLTDVFQQMHEGKLEGRVVIDLSH